MKTFKPNSSVSTTSVGARDGRLSPQEKTREAIQDYECLAILDRLGKTEEAQKIVRPLAESFFVWEKSPGAYDTACARLADLITSASRRKE